MDAADGANDLVPSVQGIPLSTPLNAALKDEVKGIVAKNAMPNEKVLRVFIYSREVEGRSKRSTMGGRKMHGTDRLVS